MAVTVGLFFKGLHQVFESLRNGAKSQWVNIYLAMVNANQWSMKVRQCHRTTQVLQR